MLILKINFFKKKNPSGILSRVPNGLDPDQDRSSIGPDLGSNCMQRLPATTKVAASKKRVKQCLAAVLKFHRFCLFQTNLFCLLFFFLRLLLFISSRERVHRQ